MHAVMETRPLGRVFAFRQAGRVGGFTLVEMVVTLVVLSILAITVIPRFVSVSSFEALGYADSSAAAARLARRMAVSSGCDTRFEIDADGYALWQRQDGCDSGGFTRSVGRPGGEEWAEDTPNNVAVSSLDLYFDAQGQPRDTSDGRLRSNSADYTVATLTVRIEPVTGLVHLP